MFFSPSEIADYVGLDNNEFISNIRYSHNDPYAAAYKKGVMNTKIQLRFDTKRYALSGSPEAINTMRDYMSKQKIDESL